MHPRYIRPPPPPIPPDGEDDRLTDLEKKTGIGEGARDTARRVKFVVDAVAGTRDDLETQLYY